MTEDTNKPTRIIRWLFYAFVVSLPFETVGQGWLEPTTILGALLLLSTLLQPGLFLRWPPKGFWCFLVYIYVYATLSLFEPAKYRTLTLLGLFVLAQLTILGWIAFNLMRDRKTATMALLTFGSSCLALSLVQVSGIAGQAVAVDTGEIVRVTAFGFHPNNLARILMLGLLALVGLILASGWGMRRRILVTLPIIVVLGISLIQTGSRGALLALTAGFMTLLLRPGTITRKVLNGAGLLLLLGFFFLAAWQSDIMRTRFEDTFEEGDLARREKIYPTAWQMVQEKPLLGWGPITSTYELGMRLGHPEEETKNPHNLILFGLVTTGLLGSAPLFIGIGFAVVNAWKTRGGPHGILPLVMIVGLLMANMSGLYLFNKLHWLVMAYSMASVYHFAREAPRLKVAIENRRRISTEDQVSITI